MPFNTLIFFFLALVAVASTINVLPSISSSTHSTSSSILPSSVLSSLHPAVRPGTALSYTFQGNETIPEGTICDAFDITVFITHEINQDGQSYPEFFVEDVKGSVLRAMNSSSHREAYRTMDPETRAKFLCIEIASSPGNDGVPYAELLPSDFDDKIEDLVDLAKVRSGETQKITIKRCISPYDETTASTQMPVTTSKTAPTTAESNTLISGSIVSTSTFVPEVGNSSFSAFLTMPSGTLSMPHITGVTPEKISNSSSNEVSSARIKVPFITGTRRYLNGSASSSISRTFSEKESHRYLKSTSSITPNSSVIKTYSRTLVFWRTSVSSSVFHSQSSSKKVASNISSIRETTSSPASSILQVNSTMRLTPSAIQKVTHLTGAAKTATASTLTTSLARNSKGETSQNVPSISASETTSGTNETHIMFASSKSASISSETSEASSTTSEKSGGIVVMKLNPTKRPSKDRKDDQVDRDREGRHEDDEDFSRSGGFGWKWKWPKLPKYPHDDGIDFPKPPFVPEEDDVDFPKPPSVPEEDGVDFPKPPSFPDDEINDFPKPPAPPRPGDESVEDPDPSKVPTPTILAPTSTISGTFVPSASPTCCSSHCISPGDPAQWTNWDWPMCDPDESSPMPTCGDWTQCDPNRPGPCKGWRYCPPERNQPDEKAPPPVTDPEPDPKPDVRRPPPPPFLRDPPAPRPPVIKFPPRSDLEAEVVDICGYEIDMEALEHMSPWDILRELRERCPIGFKKWWTKQGKSNVGPCILDSQDPWSYSGQYKPPTGYPCSCLGMSARLPVSVEPGKDFHITNVPSEETDNLRTAPFQNVILDIALPVTFPHGTRLYLPPLSRIQFRKNTDVVLLNDASVTVDMPDDTNPFRMIDKASIRGLQKGQELYTDELGAFIALAAPDTAEWNTLPVNVPANTQISGGEDGFQLHDAGGEMEFIVNRWEPDHHEVPDLDGSGFFNSGSGPGTLEEVAKSVRRLTSLCLETEETQLRDELYEKVMRKKKEAQEMQHILDNHEYRELQKQEDNERNNESAEQYRKCLERNKKLFKMHFKCDGLMGWLKPRCWGLKLKGVFLKASLGVSTNGGKPDGIRMCRKEFWENGRLVEVIEGETA